MWLVYILIVDLQVARNIPRIFFVTVLWHPAREDKCMFQKSKYIKMNAEIFFFFGGGTIL